MVTTSGNFQSNSKRDSWIIKVKTWLAQTGVEGTKLLAVRKALSRPLVFPFLLCYREALKCLISLPLGREALKQRAGKQPLHSTLLSAAHPAPPPSPPVVRNQQFPRGKGSGWGHYRVSTVHRQCVLMIILSTAQATSNWTKQPLIKRYAKRLIPVQASIMSESTEREISHLVTSTRLLFVQ